MRVLDAGCGSGDVSLMACGMVGAGGEVTGVDVSESALAAARNKADDGRVSSARFVRADINGLPQGMGRFDVIVGRRVLMYQKDPARCADALIGHLEPGGRMIFQESDGMLSPFQPCRMPLHAKVLAWMWDTVAREGGDVRFGRRLYAVMKTAGLSVTLARAEAVLHTPESGSDLGWAAKAMAPRMVSEGVATLEEIGAETLEERLRTELMKSGEPFFRDMAFGVCAEMTV
jgi:ubiquinone/menaquinone biosynthesis C-methylase UbiE